MQDYNSNTKFVKLIGFTDKANLVTNKAIKLAEKYNCNRVDMTHLFLALVDTEDIKCSAEKLHIVKQDLMDAYKNMVAQGRFGKRQDNMPLLPENFSRELFLLFSLVIQESQSKGLKVDCEDLFVTIIELLCNIEEEAESECNLMVLLNTFGIHKEDLVSVLSDTDTDENSIYVPEEVEEIVEELNKAKYIKDKLLYGIDKYVDELIEVLCRKYKANPCLVGHAGVGKTSVVYRLVQRINSGEVPEEILNKKIYYINSAVLTANTKYRGEFEYRMQVLMKWAAENEVILFLDEIHSFLSSGKSGENSFDTAGNMIKKSLADGSIKVIGATTYSEYHQSVEQDSAFKRRLQKIDIKEPSAKDTISMIKDSLNEYTSYHAVNIKDELIENIVNLCERYMKEQYFPDKAYSILDQACAKAKLLKLKDVNEDIILEVVSKNSGIDVNKLKNSDKKALLKLEDVISKNLIGQDTAVKTVCKAIRRAKAGVREENKPMASFLFVGPTGVGKTELCKVLSKEIGLSKESFIKIDMSEFSEKSSVSKLIGSAPGYVGYGEGGQLTEKVKHNPFSLVLFDEIEKAHPEIFNSLLQLLDEGRLTDGQGQTVDFTNCIIVMTSNAGYGADALNKKALGFNSNSISISKDYKEAEKIALKELESTFRPELLNRIDNIVIFEKLSKEQCISITKLLTDKIVHRVHKEHNISLKFNKSLIEHIADKGYSDKYGARNLKREIQDTIEDMLADSILSDKIVKGDNCTLTYNVKDGIKLSVKETK